MARLYSGILLCAAGLLGVSEGFLLPPPQQAPVSLPGGQQAWAGVRPLPGFVSPFAGQAVSVLRAAAVSSPSSLGGLLVREKSQALKQQFEKAFAEAVRAPQALGDAGLTRVLEMAVEGRMWSRALQLLRLPGVELTAEHCLLALQACKYSEGKWEAALQVLDVMEARGLQCVAAYNEAMAVCGAAQRSKQVVQILDRMAKAGVPAGLSSYNMAMVSLAREKQWRKAVKIVEYMERQAVWPDVSTYTGAISACGGSGEWQRALLLLEDMVKKGVAPGVETYNAAVEACVVGKQADRALAFLDEMVRKALPLDGRSFAIGMAACSEAGKPRIDKAVQLWEEVMPGAGISPGPDTWRALVRTLGRQRLWAKAVDLLDKASLGGSDGLLTRGAALKILGEEMMRTGVVWSEEGELGQLLVSGLLAEGRSRDALALIKAGALAAAAAAAEAAGSSSTELQALQLLAKFQRQVASQEEARQAQAKQLQQQQSGQQVVQQQLVAPEDLGADPEVQQVRELCEEGRVSEGVALLAASSSLLKRPSLLRLVLEYAVASRQPQAAKELLALLPVGARSRSTYHRALRCFSSAGHWGEVAALLKEMAEVRQLPADADTFLELLQGASEHGQSLTRVQRYGVKMEQAGLPLSASHVRVLMQAFLDFNKPANVLALLRQHEPVTDTACLLLALRAAAMAGLPEDATELQGRLLLSGEAQEEASGLVLEALARGGRADEVWRQLDTPDKRAKAGPAAMHALLIAMQVLGRPGEEVISVVEELQAAGKAKDGRALGLAVEALAARPDSLDHAVSLLMATREEAATDATTASPPRASSVGAGLYEVTGLALARAGRGRDALQLMGRMAEEEAPSDSLLLAVYRSLDNGREEHALARLQALVTAAATV